MTKDGKMEMVFTFTGHSVHTEPVAWATAAYETPERVVTGVLAGSLLTESPAFIHICTRCSTYFRAGLGSSLWLYKHSCCLAIQGQKRDCTARDLVHYHTVKAGLGPALRAL